MCKLILATIFTVITTMMPLSAKDVMTVHLGDIPRSLRGDEYTCFQEMEKPTVPNAPEELPRLVRVMKQTREEVKYRDVTVTRSGTLSSILGSDINGIDSLIVRGPINDEDIHTIWASSFYDGVTVVNLEYASIQGNRLPKNAFWYQSEQYEFGSQYIDCIPLRRIILPEGLQEIGELAFSYAIALEEINFPSTLRSIRRDCFSDCISLNVNPLVIPEGVEEIGFGAFINCEALTGRIVLPSTIKRIGGAAFFQCKLSECNFPEGLEEIGDAAFYASGLREVILPNSCQSFRGYSHFMLNYELERVVFPDGVKVIPMDFVNNCLKLEEFIMPDSLEEIGLGAFWQCGALRQLHLSSNLKTIGDEGLYYCKGLSSISFPSCLESLGAESCMNWKNIKEIHCAAPVPPVCIESTQNIGYAPFGPYGSDFVNRTHEDIPVYVPIGCAELYRNSWGWDYFTNYIETDFSGIEECISYKEDNQKDIYDLFGRKISNPVPNQIYIKDGKKIMLLQ